MDYTQEEMFEREAPKLPELDAVYLSVSVKIFNNGRASEATHVLQHGSLGYTLTWGETRIPDVTQERSGWALECVRRLEQAMTYLTPFPMGEQAPQDTQGDAQHEGATDYEPDRETISDFG